MENQVSRAQNYDPSIRMVIVDLFIRWHSSVCSMNSFTPPTQLTLKIHIACSIRYRLCFTFYTGSVHDIGFQVVLFNLNYYLSLFSNVRSNENEERSSLFSKTTLAVPALPKQTRFINNDFVNIGLWLIEHNCLFSRILFI